MVASATLLLLGVLTACSSEGGTHGVVVAISADCVFVEVQGRPNQCVPPHFNTDAGAARVGDCFRINEDASERLIGAHREDCPSG